MPDEEEKKENTKIMRKKIVIDTFRKDMPEETKGMTDEEILDMIRSSVWETDKAKVEFVDQ